jgi:NAD(P)-dependent dehydrogenase (short-subunit alcohol dehydrogenase family)
VALSSFTGKTAVITGGGGGIGRAIGEALLTEGMNVVLADVQPGVLDATVAELKQAGAGDRVTGVPCNVGDWHSVCELRDAAVAAYGAVHVLCNNAGIGAGAEGRMWEHELNDWKWALAVNTWGVIHGINAFVPGMLESGEQGHVVNTSSGNGGLVPLVGTPQYAVTKATVVTITECLYGQLREIDAPIGASVLFPGPHMLRTGLFESWRSRLPEFEKQRPRQTPYTTVEQLEDMMKAAGRPIAYTPVEEVADRVVDAIRTDRFWILPESETGDAKVQARTESILTRTNPTYLTTIPG